MKIETTPWYRGYPDKPLREGPYECTLPTRLRTLAGETVEPEQWRWFDGELWSKPLDYDPDLDDEIKKPGTGCFIADVPPGSGFNFFWRGLVADPNAKADVVQENTTQLANSVAPVPATGAQTHSAMNVPWQDEEL